MRFLHHFAVRAVEDGVVDVVIRKGLDVRLTVEGSRPLGLQRVLLEERGVRRIDGGYIGGNGERAVDFRVLGVKFWLVKVVCVHHVCPMHGYGVHQISACTRMRA